MTKKKFKRMTVKDFDQIKLLLTAKLNKGQITEITGRANSVINAVERAETFADYQRLMVEKNARYAAKRHESQEEKVVTNGQTQERVYTTNDILTVLLEINKNLQRMADAWERQPEKTGIRKFL